MMRGAGALSGPALITSIPTSYLKISSERQQAHPPTIRGNLLLGGRALVVSLHTRCAERDGAHHAARRGASMGTRDADRHSSTHPFVPPLADQLYMQNIKRLYLGVQEHLEALDWTT